MRRRWFVLLTLLAFVLALAAGGLLWQAVETSSVSALQTRVAALKPMFTGIRLLLITLVALAWPVMTQRLYRAGTDRCGTGHHPEGAALAARHLARGDRTGAGPEPPRSGAGPAAGE